MKRYKDSLKANLKNCNIDDESWEAYMQRTDTYGVQCGIKLQQALTLTDVVQISSKEKSC